jgi:hypothetical protein
MPTIATILPPSGSFAAQSEWSYSGPTGSAVGSGEGISGFGIPASSVQSSSLWSSVQGKPFVTVSAIGQAQTGIVNAGADYGPDTPGTTMNGLDSAIASGAGIIYVLNNGTHNWSPSGTVGSVQNGQIVVFEGGCTVNWNTTNIIVVGTNAAGTTQYSHNVWLGNGTHIINKSTGETGIYVQGIMCHVDGFELDGNGADAIHAVIRTPSSGGNQPVNCTLSNIHIYNFTGPSGTIPLTFNGATNCAAYDCFVDGSNVSTSDDYSLLYVNCDNNNTSNCKFVRCRTKGNGASGQCLEIQGNENGNPYSTQYLLFEDCTFNSGATSPAAAGGGGPYLDDNNNSGSSAFIANITFSNCNWINCTMTYQSSSSHFGYIRYEGGMPQGFSGTLLGRSAGQSTQISIQGTSPFTYTNNDGFLEEVVVVAGVGTITDISIDGVSTGLQAGVFSLGAGHSIAVSYSATPQMFKIPR